MSNKVFREWVETLPDETWAKKDLSACRLGWDNGMLRLREELMREPGIPHKHVDAVVQRLMQEDDADER